MLDAALAQPWQPRSHQHAFAGDVHLHLSPISRDLCFSCGPLALWIAQEPDHDWDARRSLAAQAFGPDVRRQMAAVATLLAGIANAETVAAFLPVPRDLHGPRAAPLVVTNPAQWQDAVAKWRLPDARDVRPPVLRRLPSSLLLPPLPGSAHDRIAAADAAVALLPGLGLALA
jgi:hypothetical protein